MFPPRQERWVDHFLWTEDGTKIQGRTPCGRATVLALQLNNIVAVTVRRYWVQAGWHPPQGVMLAELADFGLETPS